MENNTLKHHGVIGMKWGVRRYQNKDGTLTNAGKKRYAKELAEVKEKERILKNKQKTQEKFDSLARRRKAAEEALGKNEKIKKSPEQKSKESIKSLSEEELRAKVARLELEKRYRDLMKSTNPPPSKKGTDFVKGIMEDAGKNIGKQLVTYILGTAVNATLKGVFKDESVVNPKKGQKDK